MAFGASARGLSVAPAWSGDRHRNSARFETEMWHPNIYPDGRVVLAMVVHWKEGE